MNGGAYGAEIADVLVSARGVARDGTMRDYSIAEMRFTYRHCGVAPDVIFTQARFRGQPGDPEAIRAEMAAITAARAATQPVNTRTGGSTFKNPLGAKAWELVDRAGCRGLVHGDAQVSELHTNFLVNRGSATADDIEAAGRAGARPRAENERHQSRMGDRPHRQAGPRDRLGGYENHEKTRSRPLRRPLRRARGFTALRHRLRRGARGAGLQGHTH